MLATIPTSHLLISAHRALPSTLPIPNSRPSEPGQSQAVFLTYLPHQSLRLALSPHRSAPAASRFRARGFGVILGLGAARVPLGGLARPSPTFLGADQAQVSWAPLSFWGYMWHEL